MNMNKKDFFDRPQGCYYMDNAEEIAAYCIKYFPEDVEHILRVAEEVCENIFLFDLKWDMERTYEPIIFKDEIDWNFMPANDPEFIWQFNRHRYFICLGQAYQLTKNEKYTQCFMRLLEDWVVRIPLVDENKFGPWRTLETGLRGEYWNKALHYFKDSPLMSDGFIELFYKSMLEHGEHIIANHYAYKFMSNWGVIENHGLFEIGIMLPQSERTREFVSIALNNLEIEARLQIMDDGVHWEQSPMYHNEVLHCYLDVLLLAKRNNISVPNTLKAAIKKMVEAGIAGMKPDGHQLMMGDSDDTDIRDLINVAAYIFEDPVFRFYGNTRLDFESVWDIGIIGSEIFRKMEKTPLNYTSVALEDSGNYYLRTSWKNNANYLHFHCGTLGAGHGHSDKLHIDLVIEGEDILMDAGRYTYVTGPDRFEFKDPTAHNTLIVDKQFFTVCKDNWECSKLSQPVKQQWKLKEHLEFVQGGHLGYQDIGVFLNRKIIHIKPDIYIFVDECYSGEKHIYNQFFHFNSVGDVSVSDQKVTYTGIKACADIYFLSSLNSLHKKPSRLSRNYNLVEENVCIETEFSGSGLQSAITVIHGGPKGELGNFSVELLPVKSALKHNLYPSSKAEALKIRNGSKTYVVIICHEEVNSPTDLVEVDGCLGYGSVIVFDKDRECIVGDVLCW